jgi:hypothetical protein
MQEIINSGSADSMIELNQIAENMLNICETEFQNVLDTTLPQWQGEAAKLFARRMENLRNEIVRDVKNLLHYSS